MIRRDCSKTLDFVHEVKRMCQGSCGLLEPSSVTVSSITQGQIDIIQEWSDKHPDPELVTITQFEIIHLKAMEIWGMRWISKNKDGSVWCTAERPVKSDCMWVTTECNDMDKLSVDVKYTPFSFLSWEDKAPYSISAILKANEGRKRVPVRRRRYEFE